MGHSPEKIAAARVQLDRFAELLSQDIPLLAIRERMGLTNGRAQQLMLKLRADLGWQAQ
jgi:hypothetical protein